MVRSDMNRVFSLIINSLWSVPDGFATLLGACATVIAGLFAIFGAWIAWRSIQQQIRSAENIESRRREHETTTLKLGFTADLLVYSRPLFELLSYWNDRQVRDRDAEKHHPFPVLQDPLFYRSNIGQIGMLQPPWVAASVITFYANLLELNEQYKDTQIHRVVGFSVASVATRLRLMSLAMAEALDGINDSKKLFLPNEIVLAKLTMVSGEPATTCHPSPESVQELLVCLAKLPAEP